MIVGTAGHIDHGKTSLVRALTGIDTDRLKEEKARGISIELGYAYVAVDGSDQVLGFVDVPGHERFVHTMVSGASGIDFVLLVVASDDGVMPQTREHLAIVETLGVRQAAVALTKVDRVDAARLQSVHADIAALLAATQFADVELFACNATDPDDAGVAQLRAHLLALAATHAPLRHLEEFFRMPVDRLFVLPGRGTMVAGAIHGGSIAAGDPAVLMPANSPVRVRSVHAQHRPAERALAGQRCALNLAGIAREAIVRGDWIADPRALVASRHVDVRLRLGPGNGRLRDWTPMHVHWGSMHRLAHVVPLEAASADGLRAQLVFEQPVCASTGDRFVVRDARASATIGGGVVLDPEAPQRRRRSPQRLAWLAALEAMLAGEGAAPLLAQAPQGVALEVLARRLRRPLEHIALPADAVRLGNHAITSAHHDALALRIEDWLRDWHAAHPDDPGLDTGRLRRLVFPTLDATLLAAVLDVLQDEGRLRRNGAWWHLPGHGPRVAEGERALLDRLLPLLLDGGFDPPWVRTLAASIDHGEDTVRGVLRRAAARGEAWQVVHDLFYHPARIAELAGIGRMLAQQADGVGAAAFRDAVGLGRKRSIQLLEFFDRAGYTRRSGDVHRLRGDRPWNPDAG